MRRSMKHLPGSREPDPRSGRRMPTVSQGADRCRTRQACGWGALCPPLRGLHPAQGPQPEGARRPGRKQRLPLLHVRLIASAGPARAARLAHGGDRPLPPLHPPMEAHAPGLQASALERGPSQGETHGS